MLLALVSLVLLADVNDTVGGFIWEMCPSFKLRLESERSERAEENPDDDDVRLDCN